MHKQYSVRLTDTERGILEGLVNRGKGAAHTLTHARILLKADRGPDGPAWTDAMRSAALDVSIPTIERVRRTLVRAGFDAALQRKPQPPRARKRDGHHEAQLVALTCSPAPEGHKRWTLRLLADKLVELTDLDGLAPETVRLMLKKTTTNLG